MDQEPVREDSSTFTTVYLDLAIRLSMVAGLLSWSFIIVRPFITPIIWGSILAVATSSIFMKLCRLLGNRTKTSATLFVAIPLLVLSAPLALLIDSLISDVMELAASYRAGTLSIPAPPAALAKLPLVGKPLEDFWSSAQQDLTATLAKLTPQLLGLRGTLLHFFHDMGMVLITLFFSLVVMAILLANQQKVSRTLSGLGIRVAGERGESLIVLARDTIRSVVRGIVGVALIQAVLGGLGCVVAGVPAAGIWTLAMLVVAIAQLPTLLVLGPITLYLYAHDSLLITLVFGAWSLMIGVIDNFLKPLLMGQGVAAPMLVVFMGAIGGLLSAGVLGLFVGPVILVVTFTLAQSWANLAPDPTGDDLTGASPPAPEILGAEVSPLS